MTKQSSKCQSLDCIFKPKSIAVIGASTKRGSIGREILNNLLAHGFNGMVFPVNPKAEVINSMKCYASVNAIPDSVDLAVIVVPKDGVLAVAEECGKKGVKGLIVISAGFKEIGGEGIELENQLLKIVHKYGMRMAGPNCMGAINLNPDVQMNATFARSQPPFGKVGYMSQSGALGVVILEYAASLGLGFSMFLSVGNKADVSGNDLLEYWSNDPDTEIILLYLENFGDAARFTRIARQISKKKIIAGVKAGRTRQGARAVSSHTGSLAGLDMAVDALFDQCGILRASSVEEFFNLALALSHQPLPKGNRVAIITNAGGPGILATDACVSLGLDIAQLSARTSSNIKNILPQEASVNNPIDLIASGGPQQFSYVVKEVLKDPNVDAIIVIFVPPIMIDNFSVAQAVAQAAAGSEKPVLGCFMGDEKDRARMGIHGNYRLPIYAFPESCAKILEEMLKYYRWKTKAEGKFNTFKVDKEKAAAILKRAKPGQLPDSEVREILTAYGLTVAASGTASGLDDILELSERIGYPVVFKANQSGIIHKTDVGGVVLDIRNDSEAVKAYKKLKANLEKKGIKTETLSVTVQEMIKGGKEVVMGMFHDPGFGPLMMFGLGGIYVETIKDVVFKIHPLSDIDAMEMITSLKGYPLLEGVRGEKPVDMEILVESLQRLSQLVNDFPQIDQFDINPFIVCEKGEASRIVDARMTITSNE